jgi:putative hydrolase of the HAD superfamily
MTIKAVLFDLDNTLIDFIKMKRESCISAVKAMRKAGLEIDEKICFDKLMDVYYKIGLESDVAITTFLKELTGKINKNILQAGIDGYLKAKPNFLKPYPYVLETLEMLKSQGLKLGIVTDARREKAIHRLNAMKITKFFDIIVTYTESGVKKPDFEPFKLAIKKLELDPENILFVGDSVRRDIEPAEKLKMKTLLIKRYDDLNKIIKLIDYSLV